jgi:hypothetical protein
VIGDVVLAGRWTRWFAKLLDSLVIFVPAFLVGIIMGIMSGGAQMDEGAYQAAFWLVALAVFAVQAYYLTRERVNGKEVLCRIESNDARLHGNKQIDCAGGEIRHAITGIRLDGESE